MKKLVLFLALIVGTATYYTASSQSVNISINIGSQPAWGPIGYDYVNYYYLPDIDVYYDVNMSLYYYWDRNRWMSARYLPYRYHSYDFYRMYKVVINEPNPWRYNRTHRREYARYKGNHNQMVIRNSRDDRYRQSRNNDVRWVESSRNNNNRRNSSRNEDFYTKSNNGQDYRRNSNQVRSNENRQNSNRASVNNREANRVQNQSSRSSSNFGRSVQQDRNSTRSNSSNTRSNGSYEQGRSGSSSRSSNSTSRSSEKSTQRSSSRASSSSR